MNRQSKTAVPHVTLPRDSLRGDYRDIIGESSQIFDVLRQIENMASTQVKVLSYPWPGNVRELENVIESASYLIKGKFLLPEHLPKALQTDCLSATRSTGEVSPLSETEMISVPIGTPLALIEETAIRATLRHFDGNRTKTAAASKIDIRTLQRKLKKYGI